MFDLLILNGTVIDGTGKPHKTIDVGIKDGRISEMGDLNNMKASKVVDAKGLLVTPGFIDLHSHSDFALLLDGSAQSFVRQGVTTEVIGNCGMSCAPLGDPDMLKRNIFCFLPPYEADWSGMDQYVRKLERRKLGINVAPLAGHASIRSFVMGYDRREATKNEIAEMSHLLQDSLDAGAWGFSTGLEYFPGMAASQEEINTLCDIVKRYDGLYTTHVKNRDEHYKTGFGEAFDAAKKNRCSTSNLPRRAQIRRTQ